MGRRLLAPPSFHKKREYIKIPDSKQDQIKDLATGQFTVSEISRKVNLGYSIIYNYVLRENLTVKFLPGTKAESQIRQKNMSNEFFNADEKNWY